MIIYFVNKDSKIKGPFDILDANRNRIIRVGDFCIQETSSHILLLLVVSEINKWNACKQISSVSGAQISLDSNTLLFSFDGISKRLGKKNELKEFQNVFKEEPMNSFFINAIDILEYKEDWWDIGLFQKMITLNPIEITLVKNDIDDSSESQYNGHPCFIQYFPHTLKERYVFLKSQNSSLKEIYNQIKTEYPKEFRSALVTFVKNNPQKTIYDLT